PGRRPGPLARAPIALEGSGISLEALKKAEGSDTLVARIVETRGAGTRAVLRCAAAEARARETDLLERPIGEYRRIGDGLEFELKSFEIKTFEISSS
ncbi:MAG: glycosyl hydrolase-related protein, partial [Spirochaetaceae bacterium]|nr:glycosyl hydrolase-related protein [Spirochaetaceae bacterium]